MTIEAYPLHWPAGWRRTNMRRRAKFGKKDASQHGGSSEKFIKLENAYKAAIEFMHQN